VNLIFVSLHFITFFLHTRISSKKHCDTVRPNALRVSGAASTNKKKRSPAQWFNFRKYLKSRAVFLQL
jgi:hypothetical protein